MAVTGADGFIGSHLVEGLLAKGFRVRALSQYNSFNNWGWLEDIAPSERLEIVSGDIRDAAFVDSFMEGADTVYHLAALIAIPFSYSAPESYVDTNIKGTLNVCQAARRHGTRRVVITSTSEVYGTALQVPISEAHPRQPQSPYSATKIAADALALSFWHSFNLPVVVARPFNTFGPRQSARAFIPTVITQIASGMTTIKVGDLRPSRDFNFVEDTVAGFIALGTTPGLEGKEINISTGRDVTMRETLETIRSIMGRDEVTFEVDPARLRPEGSEVMRLCGDNSLITSLTDWRPRFTLEQGLRKTVEWFTAPGRLEKYKPQIYNR